MIKILEHIALNAGKIILDLSKQKISPKIKHDQSPVTNADILAHNFIIGALSNHFPNYQIISEESNTLDKDNHNVDFEFFLVDPLDGTKEFISGTGEYTVNIAFIQNGRPLYGVIYTPSSNILYSGDVHNNKAYKKSNLNNSVEISTSEKFMGLLAISKSHFSESEIQFANLNGFINTIKMGSSLKGCLIAEGTADCYIRFGDIHGWDIAAMDAIVTASGAKLLNLKTKESIHYFPNRELLRHGFIVANLATLNHINFLTLNM